MEIRALGVPGGIILEPVSEGFKQFTERFSRRQQAAIGVLAAIELGAKLAAARDIQRRPAGQVRGSKLLWRLALLVNTFGPLGYFLFGRRRVQQLAS